MPWIILLAAAGFYLFFIAAPSVVAGILVFKVRPGAGFEELTADGQQFAPYRKLLTAARERLNELSWEQVETGAFDGAALCGMYADGGSDRTVIFAHGYRSDIMINFAVQAEAFARHGYNILMIRQRGQLPGSGQRCTLGLLEQYDLCSWNEWALSRRGVLSTVIYGMSMGASAAAFASDKLSPGGITALILDCGFSSPYEQIYGECKKRHLPGPLMMPVIRLTAWLQFHKDLKAQVKDSFAQTAIPCFFLHGTGDTTVPIERGRANYISCASKKYFFTAEGAGHTEAFLAEPERAEKELFDFLKEVNEL
ncbi:MAG: alpha/beta hydrolase [Lachnospiraceae bacterium]|nr:alpha/beta hydrolase [Lachnospiraceae bacterium]